VDPKLHQVLAEEIPRIGRLKNVEAANEAVYRLIERYLQEQRDQIEVADLDMAAIICFTAVDALTHAAVLRRPDLLSSKRAEVFVNGVTERVTKYLKKPSSVPPKNRRRSARGPTQKTGPEQLE
jgi:Tetracyclin repressor-like, C-terminal domain